MPIRRSAVTDLQHRQTGGMLPWSKSERMGPKIFEFADIDVLTSSSLCNFDHVILFHNFIFFLKGGLFHVVATQMCGRVTDLGVPSFKKM